LHATGRIAEGFGDERDTRINTVVLEPGASAELVPQQVPGGQDKLDRRIGQGACTGRGRRGVLGVGDGHPAEDHQNGDADATSPYGHVH